MSETQQLTEEEFLAAPWLHIYAQYAWHDSARIMGTRAALKGLRDAIDRALSTGMESEAEAITNDGEGYAVEIAIRSYAALLGERLPYTAKYARDTRKPEEPG